MYKQVIILRNDLKMGKGKLVAQGSHASLISFLNTQKNNPSVAKEWLNEGQKKIVLKVNSEKELFEVFRDANIDGFSCCLIRDAGHTQIPSGTATAVGIGPDKEEKLEKITGKLKLL
ncbi:aminoacyl-tRNA hydrolase [Methanococcus aeolicus]|uniref:aminoacyl-tRNA hydrolase n=1 Tax=Methanococcus aeolicus TaxID=42879 RepID=UPI0021C8B9E2|nr:aminoacyl-tRNA hydrolase [Methanococcus aeolicus]UXM84830.1 aminoacyl-tRNA hydrolase [Methanococcus aeolicus]